MIDDFFYVQLHQHTSESSACGRISGAETAYAAKAAGYDLIIITDHFLNANTSCPKDLPWAEKVEWQMRGYRAAKRVGDEIGLEVLFGWETFSPDPNPERPAAPELLTYGLGEDFLLAHPDILEWSYYDYIRRVYEAGGRIIHAHPYRRRWYIPEDFKPDPDSVEAYEVYNSQNNPEENPIAYAEAKAHNLLMFAGSDSHSEDTIPLGAMRFPYPVHTIQEIFEAVRKGDGEIVETMRK